MGMTGKVLQTYRARWPWCPWGKPLGSAGHPAVAAERAHLESGSPAPGAVLLPRPHCPRACWQLPSVSPLRRNHQSCCSLKGQPQAGDGKKRGSLTCN